MKRLAMAAPPASRLPKIKKKKTAAHAE